MPVKPVDSLLKGLSVLEALARHPGGLALPEVVAGTGLPKATAYRMLKTLTGSGYLLYFPGTATYRLGPKVMSLGMSALAGQDLAGLSDPLLRELSKRIGQNVNLGILDGGEVVYIIRIKVRRILGIDLTVGSRLSAHNTAIGLALLAFMDSKALPETIDLIARDPQAAKDIGAAGNRLLERLEGVRRRGYALIEDEYFAGLMSVAVPILGRDGLAEGAINVPVFSQLCSQEELLEQYLPRVLETARTISQLRGHSTGEAPDARSRA